MTVMWITDQPEAGRVLYGKTESQTALVASQVAKLAYKPKYAKFVERYAHKARIERLEPDTRYVYSLECQGTRSEWHSFRTLPSGGKGFSFIIYGDNRTYVQRHKEVVANFARHKDLSFIINTGDLSRRSGDYTFLEKELFLPLAGVIGDVPLVVCPGNHDRSGTNGVLQTLFETPLTVKWYSFDCANAHFCSLYSDVSDREKPKMLAWLREDLDSPSARAADWRIAVFHIPPYNLAKVAKNWGREDVMPILRQKGVDIVFSGDAHGYQRFRPLLADDAPGALPITCIISAGGGATLRNINDRTGLVCGRKTYNYSTVRVDGERFELKTYDSQRRLFDSLVLTKKDGKLDPAYVATAIHESEVVKAMEKVARLFGCKYPKEENDDLPQDAVAVPATSEKQEVAKTPAGGGEKPLFSFGIFSDNKNGSPKLTNALKMFRDTIGARFIMGPGDHVDGKSAMGSFEKSLADAYGSAQAFYKIFYPAIGDNEDRHYGPDSKCRPDTALKAGWYERLLIAKRDGAILRPTIKEYEKTHGDYYAVIECEGVRIHLVSLYFTDAMKKMLPESAKFGEDLCGRIKQKYPDEPMIVMAHETQWWGKQKLPRSSPIFQADIILEASSHAFYVRDNAPPGPLVFNTSSLLDKIPGHVFEVRVFKDRFELLALGHQGYTLGPYELEDWRKVWVKPFGAEPRPVLKWEELESIAGAATPGTERDGFHLEKVLFTARTCQYTGAPDAARLRERLDSTNPEESAIALLSLGYVTDGKAAAQLLAESLPKQARSDLQAHAVVALLRNHPREALPFLRYVVKAQKEYLLDREDYETIAKQKDMPERLQALVDCLDSTDGHTVYLVLRAMRRLGPEAASAMPKVIAILKDETRDRWFCYRWMASARILGAIGPQAEVAIPLLIKRLELNNRYLTEAVVKAIAQIGGPEARKFVPRLREMQKSGNPIVRKAAEKALKTLGEAPAH